MSRASRIAVETIHDELVSFETLERVARLGIADLALGALALDFDDRWFEP
jgi:hypothetical protein